MNYDYITSNGSVSDILSCIDTAPLLGIDIETTSLQPFMGRIRLLQLRIAHKIYICDFLHISEENQRRILYSIEKSKAIKIGHTLKFEQKWFLYWFGVELGPIFDTHRASELIYNGYENLKQDLWSVLERELGIKHESQDFQASNWAGELSKGQLDYAAGDVAYLFDLREALKKKLVELELLLAAKIEFDVVLPEAAVELNGFNLDKDLWSELLIQNITKRTSLRKKLLDVLPEPRGQTTFPGFEVYWDLDSHKQMLSSIKCIRGLEETENTMNTTLVMLADKHPVMNDIIDYREVSKRCTSYSDTYAQAINSSTGRIHCDYWPFLLSGRYGIRKPNLGQIPREGAYRACFKAPVGSKLIIADYKNIEMCIIAEFSRDQTLLDIFRNGKDAHIETAAYLKDKSPSEITKSEKQEAKPLNFGFGYGMGAAKLILYAKAGFGVSLTEEQAENFRKKWFARYSNIENWHRKTLWKGKNEKISKTISGRRRYMPDKDMHGEFLNNPVQGTGADILKRALRLVYEGLKKEFCQLPVRRHAFVPSVMMVHHVHDEIVLECVEEQDWTQRAQACLKKGMKEAGEEFLKQVPVVVEGGIGKTWADK